MYKSATFFRINHPLPLADMANRFGGNEHQTRMVPDQNNDIDEIVLGYDFYNQYEDNGNYICEVNLEYQIRLRRGAQYQTTRDPFTFIFFIEHRILVVLGRNAVLGNAVDFLAQILHPDIQALDIFSPIQFGVDSLTETIRTLRDDDPGSWCDSYNARHEGERYQGRKTKTNYSLGPGECVLRDPEAIEAINMATSISPTYKFFTCTRLNNIPYTRPKSMKFNTLRGTVYIPTQQEFESWYRFIADFLLNTLEFMD